MSTQKGIPRANNRRDKKNSRLYALRLAHNLSQRELADRAGVSRNTVLQVENGDCLPMVETLQKICAVLNVSVKELIQ